MRPRTLHLNGFTAFRNVTEIDFDGADLFALTGPTGSGKSSVIDAICFALYGSIPRLSGIAPIISLGKPEARIRLTFDVSGSTYTVSRLIVRQGEGASQRDVRLEGPDLIVEGVRDVDARIEQLLGLSFDHFTRTVVLPQGRFAAFLEDGPAARERLLKQLLDLGVYEEMRKRGASNAARLEGEIATVDAQLHDLLVDPQRVRDTEEQLARLIALRDLVAEMAATEEKSAAALREATEERRKLSAQIGQLAAVSPPAGLDRIGERLVAARGAVAEAQKNVAESEKKVTGLSEQRAELGEIAAIDGALESHRRVVELRERLEKGTELIEEARREHAAATEKLAAADERLERASTALRDAEQTHAAHAIRAQLSAGDDCPVCLQKIASIPTGDQSADLEAAGKAVTAATEERKACADRMAELNAELARLEGHHAQRTEELDQAMRVVAELPSVDVLTTARERAVALDVDLNSERERLAGLRADLEKANAALQEAERAGQIAADALDRTRDTLAGLDPPVPSRINPADDWGSLVDWAGRRKEALVERETELAAEVERREEEVSGLRNTLRSAAKEAGIEDPGEDVKMAVATTIATTEATLTRMRSDLEKKERLQERRKSLDNDRLRYDETAKLLRSNRFQQWLIEEALVGLVAFANAELEKLAGGAYSLVVDGGEFEVIDHRNAEARRSVRTLSGGETFLVSLALALALAERVVATSAIGTARIESMFLDEGFGTLDTETLETVATVVQELGSRDRMVGLVTHVRELADQIPTRFEVKRLPDGATVTRVDT